MCIIGVILSFKIVFFVLFYLLITKATGEWKHLKRQHSFSVLNISVFNIAYYKGPPWLRGREDIPKPRRCQFDPHPSPHDQVSLCRTLTPKLLLAVKLSPCHLPFYIAVSIAQNIQKTNYKYLDIFTLILYHQFYKSFYKKFMYEKHLYCSIFLH